MIVFAEKLRKEDTIQELLKESWLLYSRWSHEFFVIDFM